VFSYGGDTPIHWAVRRPLTPNLIRTSICDKYSGMMKITTSLDHIGHCKTTSGTNWSNRWTYPEYSTQIFAAIKCLETLNALGSAAAADPESPETLT